MINDIIFSESFVFNVYRFRNYRYTDNRGGIDVNYFAYMTKGRCKICTSDESVDISEGDIFFLPNGCKYQSYWYGEPEIEFISLGFAFMPNFDNRYYGPQVVMHSDGAAELMRHISEISALDCAAVGKFYTLVGMLMPNMVYKPKEKQAELVERAKRLITAEPSLSVSEIARRCAVSSSALYSAFARYSDKSINDTKRIVIMERAKRLLTATDYSIEEISLALGFSSCTYFRKCFKEHFGASPREMRDSLGI